MRHIVRSYEERFCAISAVGLFDVAVFVGAELLLAGLVGVQALAGLKPVGVAALRLRRRITFDIALMAGGLSWRLGCGLVVGILLRLLVGRHGDVLTVRETTMPTVALVLRDKFAKP